MNAIFGLANAAAVLWGLSGISDIQLSVRFQKQSCPEYQGLINLPFCIEISLIQACADFSAKFINVSQLVISLERAETLNTNQSFLSFLQGGSHDQCPSCGKVLFLSATYNDSYLSSNATR
jgi:hypothetical protein